jgi:hypothetical protein
MPLALRNSVIDQALATGVIRDIILVGTHIDRDDVSAQHSLTDPQVRRSVEASRGYALAQRWQGVRAKRGDNRPVPFYEMSSRTGNNVDRAFLSAICVGMTGQRMRRREERLAVVAAAAAAASSGAVEARVSPSSRGKGGAKHGRRHDGTKQSAKTALRATNKARDPAAATAAANLASDVLSGVLADAELADADDDAFFDWARRAQIEVHDEGTTPNWVNLPWRPDLESMQFQFALVNKSIDPSYDVPLDAYDSEHLMRRIKGWPVVGEIGPNYELPDSLRIFRMNACVRVGGNLADVVLPPQLATLSLTHCWQLTGDVARLQLPASLQELTLRFCPALTGDVTEIALQETPNLTILTLEGCAGLRGDMIRCMRGLPPSVRELRLGDSPGLALDFTPPLVLPPPSSDPPPTSLVFSNSGFVAISSSEEAMPPNGKTFTESKGSDEDNDQTSCVRGNNGSAPPLTAAPTTADADAATTPTASASITAATSTAAAINTAATCPPLLAPILPLGSLHLTLITVKIIGTVPLELIRAVQHRHAGGNGCILRTLGNESDFPAHWDNYPLTDIVLTNWHGRSGVRGDLGTVRWPPALLRLNLGAEEERVGSPFTLGGTHRNTELHGDVSKLNLPPSLTELDLTGLRLHGDSRRLVFPSGLQDLRMNEVTWLSSTESAKGLRKTGSPLPVDPMQFVVGPLPASFGQLRSLTRCDLPWRIIESLPPELTTRGNVQSIVEYVRSLNDGGVDTCWWSKLMVVGFEEQGKTSFLRAIREAARFSMQGGGGVHTNTVNRGLGWRAEGGGAGGGGGGPPFFRSNLTRPEDRTVGLEVDWFKPLAAKIDNPTVDGGVVGTHLYSRFAGRWTEPMKMEESGRRGSYREHVSAVGEYSGGENGKVAGGAEEKEVPFVRRYFMVESGVDRWVAAAHMGRVSGSRAKGDSVGGNSSGLIDVIDADQTSDKHRRFKLDMAGLGDHNFELVRTERGGRGSGGRGAAEGVDAEEGVSLHGWKWGSSLPESKTGSAEEGETKGGVSSLTASAGVFNRDVRFGGALEGGRGRAWRLCVTRAPPNTFGRNLVTPQQQDANTDSAEFESEGGRVALEWWQNMISRRIEGLQNKLTLSTWDFAGQQIYYATHAFFLSARALCVVVWNMAEAAGIRTCSTLLRSRTQTELIESWLQSIQLRTPGAKLMLVGMGFDLLGGEMRTPRGTQHAQYTQDEKETSKHPSQDSSPPNSTTVAATRAALQLWKGQQIVARFALKWQSGMLRRALKYVDDWAVEEDAVDFLERAETLLQRPRPESVYEAVWEGLGFSQYLDLERQASNQWCRLAGVADRMEEAENSTAGDSEAKTVAGRRGGRVDGGRGTRIGGGSGGTSGSRPSHIMRNLIRRAEPPLLVSLAAMSAKNGRGFVLRSNADPEPIGDLSRDGDGSQAVLNEIMYTLTRRSDGFFKEGTRGRPATDSTGSGSTNSAVLASTRVGDDEREDTGKTPRDRDERLRQREIKAGKWGQQVLDRGAFKGTSFAGKGADGPTTTTQLHDPDPSSHDALSRRNVIVEATHGRGGIRKEQGARLFEHVGKVGEINRPGSCG